MEGYPRTLQELESRFATEGACRSYLARLRWPQGFVCPGCKGTEAWSTKRGLWMFAGLGYRHDRRVLLGSGELADAVLPRVHRVASLLKRWLLGTHQGAVSREHLDYYLDEFTFRFNRRTSRHRGKLFYRLLEQAVTVDPVPYAAMVKGVRGRKRKHHNR